MSFVVEKPPPAYLREARIGAGYANRESAAMAVHLSPETVGRHERGDVAMRPEDAIAYATCYKAPGIMRNYCTTCPVGQKLGRTATVRSLPFATLRIRHLISDGQRVAQKLEEIAFDGVVTQAEVAEFSAALVFLKDLESGISDMLSTVGAKKDTAPGNPESGNAEIATSAL